MSRRARARRTKNLKERTEREKVEKVVSVGKVTAETATATVLEMQDEVKKAEIQAEADALAIVNKWSDPE